MSKVASSGPSAGDRKTAGNRLSAPINLIDRPQPIWRVVVFLAVPVLAQQFLILSVGLSDRFLAGRLQPLPAMEQAEAVGRPALALGLYGQALTGGGLASGLAADRDGN